MFGPKAGQKRGYCGHEEIELALVKLYRLTNKQQYLDLARYFIDERGKLPHYFDAEAHARGQDPADWWHRTYEYNQSHKPVREQDRVVGHAVRAMYLYSAMADLAGESADPSLLSACERLWADLTGKRLYVTGGLGPSAGNEGFTPDYDLPNETAYAETCAAVGLARGQQTDFPWDGKIEVRIDPERAHEFELRLRIPGWCRSAALSVNGEDVALGPATDRGYVGLRRVWQAGDLVSLALSMPVERVRAHPEVRVDQGRVALKRGPIVYCVEAADNSVPLHRLQLPTDAAIESRFEAALLGGVSPLSCDAVAIEPLDGALYSAEPQRTRAISIKAVPYHVWDHREAGEMLVWVPEGKG